MVIESCKSSFFRRDWNFAPNYKLVDLFDSICRDNFQNIIDNKKLKSELVNFSVDSEHGIVIQDHRAEAINYLIR